MIARLNSIPPLDPIAEAVAIAYDFDVKFDDELEIWIITGYSQYKAGTGADCFYWSSNETTEELFRELKRFFVDQGAEQYR